jgi:hypothetical protein
MKQTNSKKSPLKNPPLRNPAQSLMEYKDELLSDKLLNYLLYPMMFLLWAGYEWYQHVFSLPPMHWPITVVALITLGICIPKIIKLRKQVKAINRGIDGEKAVGQFLEQFRANGYQVFHDIPGDKAKGEKFNIDHVLIGPGGIFTVETKYAQKPSKGQCIVERDGDSLKVNGREPNRNPIIQAKAQSGHISRILADSTGQKFAVQPIVVYPGWYVKNLSANIDVLVLNEGMIATALANSTVSLASDKVHLAAYHLARHVLAVS